LTYWFATGLVMVATAIALGFFDRSPLFAIPVLFVLVVPFEKRFPRHPGQRLRRPALGTDLAFALASPALTFAGLLVALPVAIASLAWLPGLALRPIVGMLPGWSVTPAAVALFDLSIYWAHRWGHEVPMLWRFHSIHHSTETLDWVSGFRGHPLDGLILAPVVVFLMAAGFDPEITGALAAVQIVTGIFLHANVRWRWRPLHRIVITPEFHHWHHANEPEAINTNYSVFLPLWDMVFGTYRMPRDRRPDRYGVSEAVPAGIAAQLRHPMRGFGNPLRVARHPWRSLRSGVRWVRALLVDVRRSTFRSTARPI
jgi:sterol desaturase/sphingolipid hydroxylase (fatty acid hydroxylase superfamily)